MTPPNVRKSRSWSERVIHSRRAAPAHSIEPLESRIAPAAFDLTPFSGDGPFTLERDPADVHIHIIDGAGGEIFDAGTFGTDLFVTGGGAGDVFNIANSAVGNVAFSGTLSVNIPGAINVQGVVTTGTDLALTTGSTLSLFSAINLGTSTAHYNAARNIVFNSNSSLTTDSGNIVLLADQAAGQAGTFIGITLDHANITTTGVGTIALTGHGGTAGDGNAGIELINDAHIASTSTAATAGTITLSGTGGGTGVGNHGVYLTGGNSLITSVSGAISVTGVGNGDLTGTNTGVKLDTGAQITSTGTGATAAAIVLNGTGGGGGNLNHGVFLDGTASDPKITSIDGAITVTGTGDPAGSGPSSRGISIEQGAQIVSSGAGIVTLIGTGGNGSSDREGILITDSGTMVGSQSGAVNLTGTGGSGGGGTGNNGVLVAQGGKVSAQGAGSVTVTGIEGAGTGSEGIAVGSSSSTIASLGGSGLTLIANNINIDANALVNAATGVAKLHPKTANTPIDLGGPDVASPSTLGITGAELHQITGSAVEVGDANSGAITISTALAPESSLTLTTGATVNSGAFGLDMVGSANLTVNADGGISLGGRVTVPIGTATFSANTLSSISVVNAGNNFASVIIPSGGGMGVALRDDSGFNLGPTNVATMLFVQSAGTIMQTGVFSGAGTLTKDGAGTLVLTATNTYGGTTTISAGILQVGNSGTTGTLGSSPVVDNGTLVFVRSDTLTITNAISGNGAVQVSSGTVTLGGNNTYSGTTNVSGGTLLVDGTLANTTSVAVVAGATLGGSGTINPAAQTNVFGTLAPGDGPGVLQTGSVAFSGGASFNVEINGDAAASHDQLSVTGTVSLGGATLNATGTITSVPGQQIVLIDNDGNDPVPDTFNGLAEGAAVTVNGVLFHLTYKGGTNNNDVVLAQAPVDTEVTLSNGSLVITDITAGGHDDTLTIQAGTSNGPITITDPNHILAATSVAGAQRSLDQHTLTVPLATVNGPQIIVNTGGGDDSLTVDFSQGALAKTIVFDGGTQGAVGDTLTLAGGGFSSMVFDYTDAGSGSIAPDAGSAISYQGLEAILMPGTNGDVTLNYNSAAAANTINADAAAIGQTRFSSLSGTSTTMANPAGSLTINGGASDDTIKINSLDPGFAATLAIDGKAGSDTVTLAAGLPALTGLTVATETIGALPALTIGTSGLDITTTVSDIDINGGIAAAGHSVGLHAAGALTNTVGTIAAQNLTVDAVTGIALAIDGAKVQAVNTGAGGITLNAVNNPVTITALNAGAGTINLNSGAFLLGKSHVIADTSNFAVNGSFDLQGFDETVGALSGAGTVLRNAPPGVDTPGAFAVGANNGSATFAGKITDNITLVKVGTGTETLAGIVSYSGGTTVSAGVLEFDAFGTAFTHGFNLAGGTLALNLPGAATPLSADFFLAADSTIDVPVGKTITLTNAITGPGSLTKTGAGTLVLGDEFNTFGGPSFSALGVPIAQVKILGGTLQVATDGALGDPANDVEINNATFAASGAFASARNFSKTGSVAIIDAQVPNLTLINKAIVQADLTPTVPANLKFAFVYADGVGTPVIGTSPPFADGTTVTFGGTGTAHIHTDGMGDIDTIELTGTDLTSKLVIKGPATGFTTIFRIVIDNTGPAIASIGSIVLGKNVRLGDAVPDSVPDLYVEGAAGKLQLYDLNSYALLRLGDGLPYDVPNDQKTPDTYNNHPDLAIHAVLGQGVIIDLTPSDLPAVGGHLVGGGGLGKVVVNDWHDAGAIRTTQSIGSFKLVNFNRTTKSSTGNCLVVFQVDQFHVGTNTTANVGSMTIQSGSWGSSGSEIEGDVGSFSADAFLAGATLTAASMGKVTLDAGEFAGLITLTRLDPDAPGIPTFTVATDFTGSVDSGSPLRKIKVNGDFAGDLSAPFIGSITAYSFLDSDPDHLGTIHEIHATAASLGTLTSTHGVVRNFSIVTDQAFKGFNVKLSKLTTDTVGLDNVHIQAESIGNITVSLAAAATGATGINLTGIRDSDFVTTGTGAALGAIGNLTVTLTGGVGGATSTGIQNSTFDAVNSIGKIAVKISGQDGVSLGLDDAEFSGASIGATTLSVTPGKGAGATATAIATADFTATGAIGALSIGGSATSAMVDDLAVSAGTTVGAVTVKSTVLANGTLQDSAILAGQALVFPPDASVPTLLAALAKATLGAVNVSGSLTDTDLVAGGSIGAVTAGGGMTDSLILAGARLGADRVLGGSGANADSFQRAAAIAAITVKGAFGGTFARTSIVAGVDPHSGGFGNADDAVASVAEVLPNAGSIGPISLPVGALTTDSGTQHFAIEAAKITSLKLGAALTTNFANPQLLDLAPAGLDANDVIVRLIA